MSNTLPYLLIILGLIFTATLLMLLMELIHVQKQRKQRQILSTIVARYRLSKMLEFLGIERDKYVKFIPAKSIAQHITQCRACPNITECDNCLRDGRYVSDMNFCPNYRSLMFYSRIMPPVVTN